MPINGLSSSKYYELLGIDPFQSSIKYPPSHSGVTLTENLNYKITHPTNQEAARMGVSIALSGNGNRLLVGMPYGYHWEDTNGNFTASGRVQAYVKENGVWLGPTSPEFTMYPFEDADGTQRGGEYVALSRDGLFAAVSTYGSNRVCVITSDGKKPDFFTDGVAGPVELNADGSRLVVGMPLGGPTIAHGKVEVYGYRDAAPGIPGVYGYYNIIGQALIGSANNDKFGTDVAINDIGNIIAVAIPGADIAGTDSGGVKIYILTGTSWVQLGQTLDVNSELRVTAIDMDSTGYTVAVGAALNIPPDEASPVGEVVVYKYNKTTQFWEILGNKIINFYTASFQIGRDIRLSSDGYTLVTSNGASTLNNTNFFNETVNVYRYNGVYWILVGSFSGSSNSAQNGFSLAISSDGKTIVSGCPGTNSDHGEVRHHTLNM